MPTVQGTDDFNHAIDAGFYTDGFFGSPDQVDTPSWNFNKTLRIETSGGNEGVRHNITGSQTIGWAGFFVQVDDLPAAGSFSLANFGTAGGSVGALFVGTTGLFIANSSTNGAELAISPDTWYWVEMIFDVSTAANQIYARVNGNPLDVPAITHAGGVSTIEFIQLLNFGDPAGETYFYSWWQRGAAANIGDFGQVPSPAMWITA